jgi:membrane protein YdbS with pleckstrin-like domain
MIKRGLSRGIPPANHTSRSIVNDPESPSRTYRSQVDAWLIPLLLLPPVVSLGLTLRAVMEGNHVDLKYALLSLGVVTLIYGGLVFPMRYIVGEGRLEVRSGFHRQRVPLARIQQVRPTRNPLSAPALSLNRLEVRWGPGVFQAVLISPTPRDEFLDQLANEAGLVREGNIWIRPTTAQPPSVP